VRIKEGSVLIGEIAMTPPESLLGLKYSSKFDDRRTRRWRTNNRPAVLGEEEYFVLGDFTARSNDSRYWTDQSPGIHSYALPAANLHGVVTHIYAPVERRRIFRDDVDFGKLRPISDGSGR
jgi:hypothetical protein